MIHEQKIDLVIMLAQLEEGGGKTNIERIFITKKSLSYDKTNVRDMIVFDWYRNNTLLQIVHQRKFNANAIGPKCMTV